MPDAEKHPERDGRLHELHQQHHDGQHAYARLLVHLTLLECDTLHREVVPGLVCLAELLGLDQARLARSLQCERGRVAERLFDGEREQYTVVSGARREHPR